MEWAINGLRGEMPRKARLRDAGAYEANLLDEVNLRVLKELEANGRLGLAELGRRIGMSAPAVAERVQRLERAGVIAGYHAEIDPRGIGFPVAAIVRIRPAPGQLRRIPEIALDTSEVVECYRITGEDCFLMKLHLRSMDDLEDILDRFTPYGLTTTSIIHSAPVPRRGVPLGDSDVGQSPRPGA
jgi:Lrp/AsnC family transcriptional regulator, leucine-responsive regulatory protein